MVTVRESLKPDVRKSRFKSTLTVNSSKAETGSHFVPKGPTHRRCSVPIAKYIKEQ